MEDYFRKSKRRPALGTRAFPIGRGTLPPVPRARVPSPTPDSPRTTAATATAGGTTASSAGASRPTRAPRKRFRKKVTGLFGDQSDLQKRMQKLLRHLPDDILSKRPVKPVVTDTSPVYLNFGNAHNEEVPDKSDSLNLAKKVVDKMGSVKKVVQAVGMTPGHIQESRIIADMKEAGATHVYHVDKNQDLEVSTAASAAKWKPFQRRIGRLSPRSNDLFLDELEVGTSSPTSRPKASFEPPRLPSLEDVRQNPEGSSYVSPNELYRTGTPAMLRRKVRRNERGYRGAEVLRMRMNQAVDHDSTSNPTQKDDTVSPAGGERGEDGLEVYVRSLGSDKAEEPPVKPASSEIREQQKRNSSAKRRRVSDLNQGSRGSEVRHQDALALLIEAAEKGIRPATTDDLPPRKTKRLRSSGWAPEPSISEHSDSRKRHTAHCNGALIEHPGHSSTATPSRKSRAARNIRIQARVPDSRNAGSKPGTMSEDSAATVDEKSD